MKPLLSLWLCSMACLPLFSQTRSLTRIEQQRLSNFSQLMEQFSHQEGNRSSPAEKDFLGLFFKDAKLPKDYQINVWFDYDEPAKLQEFLSPSEYFDRLASAGYQAVDIDYCPKFSNTEFIGLADMPEELVNSLLAKKDEQGNIKTDREGNTKFREAKVLGAFRLSKLSYSYLLEKYRFAVTRYERSLDVRTSGGHDINRDYEAAYVYWGYPKNSSDSKDITIFGTRQEPPKENEDYLAELTPILPAVEIDSLPQFIRTYYEALDQLPGAEEASLAAMQEFYSNKQVQLAPDLAPSSKGKNTTVSAHLQSIQELDSLSHEIEFLNAENPARQVLDCSQGQTFTFKTQQRVYVVSQDSVCEQTIPVNVVVKATAAQATPLTINYTTFANRSQTEVKRVCQPKDTPKKVAPKLDLNDLVHDRARELLSHMRSFAEGKQTQPDSVLQFFQQGGKDDTVEVSHCDDGSKLQVFPNMAGYLAHLQALPYDKLQFNAMVNLPVDELCPTLGDTCHFSLQLDQEFAGEQAGKLIYGDQTLKRLNGVVLLNGEVPEIWFRNIEVINTSACKGN